MSFKVKEFGAIRIFSNDIMKSRDWYAALFDQAPIDLKRGGKLYRGPLKVLENQSTIMQIQDPFGNILGFEASDHI